MSILNTTPVNYKSCTGFIRYIFTGAEKKNKITGNIYDGGRGLCLNVR